MQQINYLKQVAARQVALAEAEAFLAYKGQLAVFAMEDMEAEAEAARYAELYPPIDEHEF